MIEPSAGWICATRTPAGIADSETSLTAEVGAEVDMDAEVDIDAEVDMGSDLPLRLLLFEPRHECAGFSNSEQVSAPGLLSRARLRFRTDFDSVACLVARRVTCFAPPLRAAAITELTVSTGCRDVMFRD
jgi:hypothetical protein